MGYNTLCEVITFSFNFFFVSNIVRISFCNIDKHYFLVDHCVF